MKMKWLLASLIVLTIVASIYYIYTRIEFTKKGTIPASVKPEDIERSARTTNEAAQFGGFLLCENMLPSTPQNIVERFETKLTPPTYSIIYPLNVLLEITLKETKSSVHEYTLEKQGAEKPWRIISAHQVDENKYRTALKLPSQESQQKANDKLPELMKEVDGQMAYYKNLSSIELKLGEILIAESKEGKALVWFTRFGTQESESLYSWRFRSKKHGKESSGDGKLFEEYRKDVGSQKSIHAGSVNLEWSYGQVDASGWIYYDPNKLEVKTIKESNPIDYKF